MNITIEINEARLVHYSPEAKNELKRQLDTIADSLAEEANRIEAGRRLPTSTSEVTQSDVSAAGILSKINQNLKSQNGGILAIFSCLLQAGFLVGYLMRTNLRMSQ